MTARTRKRTFEQVQRDAAFAALRRDGLTYPQIAAEKRCAVSTAFEAVQRAIADVPAEAVTQLRQIESDRLNAIIADLWPIARNSDIDAAQRIAAYREIRQASESLRRMFGLDAPTKQTITIISEDVVDAEIRRLEDEMAAREAQQRANAEA